MKAKHVKVGALACLAAAALAVAVYGAVLVAGGVLFALYKQDPRQASVTTIRDAWRAQGDKATKRKIVLSMLAGGGLCIGGPLALILSGLGGRRQLHGSARFAHSGELKAAGLRSPDGILLGKQGGQFLRLPGFEFVLLAAPTRTGKGTSFVVPNLLTFKGSVVVQDIKGENYGLTSRYRSTVLKQPVYYWNPFAEDSHRFNPLTYVSADTHRRIGDLQVLASVLFPDQAKESPIWVESARNLFVGLALLVLESRELPHTIGEILRQASGKGMSLPDHLRRVIESRRQQGNALSTACLDSLARFTAASENTLKGVLATFLAPLSIWANPAVDKATSDDDFRVDRIRTDAMSIYVCISARDIVAGGLLMNLFYSTLIAENLRKQPQDDPALTVQALLMMDEFTAMGRVGIIAKGVTFMASYNLRLAIVIQDTAQLVDVYGRESAHNILSNMGATIHFTPSELDEARELSELIGNVTERARSNQYSNNASSTGGSTGRTLSYSEQSRALMLPQEVRLLDPRKELIVRAGIPVILADKTPYYLDPVLKRAFDSVDGADVVVNGQPRRVPTPMATRPAGWDEFRTSLKDSDCDIKRLADTQAATAISSPPDDAYAPPASSSLPSFGGRDIQEAGEPALEHLQDFDELAVARTREAVLDRLRTGELLESV